MKKLLIQLTALAMVATMPVSGSYATCPQPVYIVAHRCNGVDWVSNVVREQGVNAIEADVRWDKDNGWEIGHDLVGHVPLDQWLDNVKNTINQNDSPLALVVLDIKTPIFLDSDNIFRARDLRSLYKQIRKGLGSDINLIFSIGDFLSAHLAYTWLHAYEGDAFISELNDDPRAGAAIDYLPDDEDQDAVKQLWNKVGVVDYWFGDGYSASGLTPDHVWRNVRLGTELRNKSLLACDARFHGVYTWTYEDYDDDDDDAKVLLRKSIFRPIAGVNGILVNASECIGFVSPAAEEPREAIDFVKKNTQLTGTQFADREHNPFLVPTPKIKCPNSVTVECSAPGGVDPADPQLDAFFSGAKIEKRGCDAVGDAEVEAPDFFQLNQQATVTFTAADESTCRPKDTCEAGVTVVDTTAPTIMNITTAPQMLWPPNGKMVAVTLTVVSDDVCDTTPSCQITSVTSNGARKRAKRDKISSDWTITGDLELKLRAERLGKGSGRIYSIAVQCADASGNRTQGSVEIAVPHDRRPGATAKLH